MCRPCRSIQIFLIGSEGYMSVTFLFRSLIQMVNSKICYLKSYISSAFIFSKACSHLSSSCNSWENRVNKMLQEMLDGIAGDVRHENLPLLPGDKWLLASGLQKAIRRGEVDKAGEFAFSLWYQDRRMFWRRLHVAALEDLGPAAPDVVAQVLVAHEASAWRRKAGDRQVAIHLARTLARALKSRFCDELYMYLEAGSHLHERKLLRSAGPSQLAGVLANPDEGLTARALALWMLCGTKLFPSKVMPTQAGNLKVAIEALRGMPCHSLLAEACIAVMPRTQWPLSIFTILGWDFFENERQRSWTEQNELKVLPEFEGVPIYAVDGQFTRLGQTCLHWLIKDVRALRCFTHSQVAQAAFWIEGGRLNKAFMSPSLSVLRRQSILAVMSDLGLNEDKYDQLEHTLTLNWSTYSAIRLQKLEFNICGPQYNLFEKG